MITFGCRVAGDIPMLEAHGRRLLALIGKPDGGEGIITPEQMPGALAALRRKGPASDRLMRPAPGGAPYS